MSALSTTTVLVKVILRDKFVDGKGTKKHIVVDKSLLACFSLQGFQDQKERENNTVVSNFCAITAVYKKTALLEPFDLQAAVFGPHA